ncbi:zinc finger C3H1 domain-containing protein [Synchiropus picturatus]
MSSAMNASPFGLSPKEDGELEDGEICDDEAEESIPVRLGEGSRRGRGGPPNNGLLRQHQHRHFHRRKTFIMVPRVHSFPQNHMQQCGPTGPELPPPPGPPPLLPPPQLLAQPPPPLMPHPPGLGLLGELCPRNNFWERNHGTLGRFRHRGMTNGGRGLWNRGGRGGVRTPPGRHGPGDGHGSIESPSRKQKVVVRSVSRKMVSKSEAADESFEDLLSKYKQIQLELECIRKEETMALEPHSLSASEEVTVENGSTTEHVPFPEATDTPLLDKEGDNLVVTRVFQAFNIKPLRQKLPCTVNLDQSTEDDDIVIIGDGGPERGMDPKDPHMPDCVCCIGAEPEDKEKVKTCSSGSGSSASSEESVPPSEKLPKVEEEDLSELQLRLLALQSASKKWQQKEQQVMKKSRDKITKDIQDQSAESSPAASRHRVTTRSATLAAVGHSKTSAKSLERERDKSKISGKPTDRERAKIGKVTPERARASNKSKKTTSPGSTTKQTFKKQQVRNWKLQQQKEEKRLYEEDERRKREEEIRRIRDLSNQDEQYNRFMKLVGGKMQTRSKSRDGEYRKSSGKTILDSSGNLYQYDNYDEVAMDTDSETSSPVPSPTLFVSDDPGCYPPVPLFMTDYHLHAPLGQSPPPPPLPPPPDELERPPKPPFADEEEEEEMLLRETCLMSMATKRVTTTEEKTSSGPPSPSSAPPTGTQQTTRGNLSTVNLNMVQQTRSSKFSRGHHHSRASLVLPRHKSVVISLKDSDDSDSDVETNSSSQSMFGGLEFMIKEARRTVEAAKPKVAAGPEKENNPVRTPEALPEAKKVEYRLLKEEIASREKQKRLNHVPHGAASLPAAATVSTQDSEQKSAAELKLIEVEQKLMKQRSLLQKDEVVLKQLQLQEQKKSESLRAAEAKVSRLKEQLLASEKIVSANKTLLKKLQEQVHRVEHRVSLKKSVEAKLEQELLKAQEAAGHGAKRKSAPEQKKVSKMQRVEGAPLSSERHLADLMKQKQLLQRLESEYALKIQKLKEAQAQRNKSVPVETAVESAPHTSTPHNPQSQSVPTSPFPLPQPSLHDLTQDKLTLDSDDIPDASEPDPEPAPEPEPEVESVALPAAVGSRRRSLIQSGFTKPHLEQLTSTPVKDGSSAKPSKASNSPTEPSEVIAGLDVDALKQSYQEGEQLGELLLQELQKIGAKVDDTPVRKVVAVEPDASTAADMKPVSFGPYHSPLLAFRSYRFSPYYRTKEKFSLSSVSFSNTVEPNNCFCRFDLTGTCNDDGCRWQHMRDCTFKGNQLFQDILSYDLSLISCSEHSSNDDISSATEKYMKKLFGSNSDGMSVDQKAVLLVHKVNESRRHNPPYTTCKEPRLWRPRNIVQVSAQAEEDSEDETTGGNLTTTKSDGGMQTDLSDVCVTSEDKRYFISETDDISNLESSVLESPCDTQLWIKLAFKYLNQNQTSPAECLEAALNTLSRALENNCENPEVWSHYLALFSRRGSREEVQEMCEMAVEHAPDYSVWWSYLNLERSFEGKDYVCERLLGYLLTESSSGVTEKLSFQLTEALLYRVHLNVFAGRTEGALTILLSNLKSVDERSVVHQVMAGDRALLWLSYIHLMEFSRLPADLFDPSESGPSRLVSREDFLLPWRTQQDISTPADVLLGLFHDAIAQCGEDNVPVGERTVSCLSLHLNLVYLHKLLDRMDEGVALCESVLRLHPESCRVRDALVDLHIRRGELDRAVSIWLHALVECPNNAEVFYNSCKFLMSQNKSTAIAPLLRGFVLSLCEDEQCNKQPLDVLRHILGIPTTDLLPAPNIRKELDDQLNQQSSYLHLIHCRWQWLHGSEQETVEAFERALGSVLQLEELQRLWMDYLEFTSQVSSRNPRLLSDLLLRCLSTVPSRLEVPFNPAEFWTCYHFHNKVVSFYLSCLPPTHHSLVLERLRTCMPNNIELALRLLRQDLLDGNLEHVKFQARMLTNSAPKCLSSWKIAIAVETELKQRSEVRRLLTQALQKLPLCAALWKHLLQVEAVGAPVGVSDRLRRLLLRSQEVGVSLFEVRPAQTDV